MCGIAGILKVWTPDQRDRALRTPHAQSIPEEWLDILDDSIKHRGPDGHGRFRDRAIRADGCVVDVALVHRRLSIIDHAGGHQPMVWLGTPALRAGRLLTPDERERHNAALVAGRKSQEKPGSETRGTQDDLIAVVFNGCIYNHRELRAELQNAGHVFSTDHSDTEVLVHGWREWGVGELVQTGRLPLRSEGLCSKLHDMFAYAIWDAGKATLLLARDRFGQKPLYLASLPERGIWAFASTVPGLALLLRELDAPFELDAVCTQRWLRFGCELHPPITSISALPISTTITLPSSDASPQWFEMREFWSDFWVGPFGDIGMGRHQELIESNVETSLRKSVLERLESDVPLGCFLSGGVDSSLLALFAVQSVEKLRTFSVKMPVASIDESSFAEQVANHIGTHHVTLDCAPNPAADLVAAIVEMGLPFGDSSLLPSLWVSRATRREVSVAISGDGGDELFGGYDRYRAATLLARWRFPLALVPGSSDANPKSKRTRLSRLADAARHDGYRDLVSVFPASMMRRLFPEVSRGAIRSNPYTCFGAAGAMDDDLAWYLPNDLLRKTDSASMSAALEVRCPFLAPGVAGPASGATVASLMPNGQRKGLLRAVARKYLPPEIVDRPKMGFAIPIGEWFRSDYGGLRTMLLDHLNSTEPFGPPSLGIDLNMKFIRQMLDEHLGTGPSGIVKRDHSQRLYMLLVLSIWAKWVGALR